MLTRLTDRTLGLLAMLGALGVVLMMLHVCTDIVLRAALRMPIPATVEMVSHYYIVLLAFMPLAWVERRNGMVSVELFETFLPLWLRRASDILVTLLACLIYAVMAYATWLTALSNFSSGSFVIALDRQIPTWPSYFLPPLGFALASLATLVRSIELLRGSTIAQSAQGEPA